MPPHFANSCQKNGRARRQARRGGAPGGPDGPVGAADLLDRRRGSGRWFVPFPPPAGYRASRKAARVANERRRFGNRLLVILLRREASLQGSNASTGFVGKGLRFTGGGPVARLWALGRRSSWQRSRTRDDRSTSFITTNGRRFRVLNIVDDVTKECLGAIADTSISGRRMARELAAIVTQRGKPGSILNETLIFDIDDAWAKIEIWVADYNGERPHFVLPTSPLRPTPPHSPQRTIAAQPRPAPPIARCPTLAARSTKAPDSNCRWMKVQWQVSKPEVWRRRISFSTAVTIRVSHGARITAQPSITVAFLARF
jgi:hypothetical protein